jgi:CIC family chloride channel protein
VVEANALHGGRIPFRDTLTVAVQTIASNGSGASVGLEAAYAQLGGGLASLAGQAVNLRRADLRTLVGAGAGAAISAAFGAPLTGAFYAFEVVIGAYTPAGIAPVAAACLAAVMVTRSLGMTPYLIAVPPGVPLVTTDYLIFALLGILAAFFGIGLMRLVSLCEAGFRRLHYLDRWRPLVGGVLLVPLAWVSPHALSAGHGAMTITLAGGMAIGMLVLVLVLKSLASVISLASGFRGGLFFASLFLGALLGEIFADLLALVPHGPRVDPTDSALVGMAALAVTVVGGPMTMSLLVLEATHDFAITAVVLTAALCAGTLARERFGFSFSTWRMHMRGETIRTARDIGWVHGLTARRLMREAPPQALSTLSVDEFRRKFPLGSTSRVLLHDAADRYDGIVQTAVVHAAADGAAPVGLLAIQRDSRVDPDTDIAAILRLFDESEADDLAVVDPRGRILGVLTEKHVRKRYGDEIDRAQRELYGET